MGLSLLADVLPSVEGISAESHVCISPSHNFLSDTQDQACSLHDCNAGESTISISNLCLLTTWIQLAATISTIYWGLLLFMPHLILRAPEEGEWQLATSTDDVPDLIRIPVQLDLALHAVPGTALMLDFFLFEVKYAKRTARYGGATVTALALVWYSCWVEYCASYNGLCE